MIRVSRPLVGLLVLALGAGAASVGSASAATKKATTKKTTTTKAPAATAATSPAASTPASTAPGATVAKANTASDVGVTPTSIKIGIVAADLNGLVKAGLIRDVPADNATLNAKRITYHFDKWNAAGGFNGRKIEAVLVPWDPADPLSFDKVCSRLTLDLKVFMVINPGGGYNPDRITCITGDGKTPFIGIDPVGLGTFKDSGGNLITIAPPSEVLAQAGAELAIKTDLLPKDARVGVLRGNAQFQLDAYARAKKVLDAAGIKIVFDDPMATAVATSTEQAQLTRLQVPKMQQAGVTHVLNMVSFGLAGVFAPEAKRSGLNVRYVFDEISSGMCTNFSASQGGPELDGASCATSRDDARIDVSGGIRKDTPFEAQCRTDYDAMFNFKSQVGIPFGGLTDVDGKKLTEDTAYPDCTIMYMLKTAFDKAPAELTRKAMIDSILSIDKFPAAGLSNGTAGFGPDKPFATTQLHAVTYTAGDAKASALNGLYGKCLSPRSCFRTNNPDVWTPVTATLKS